MCCTYFGIHRKNEREKKYLFLFCCENVQIEVYTQTPLLNEKRKLRLAALQQKKINNNSIAKHWQRKYENLMQKETTAKQQKVANHIWIQRETYKMLGG